MIMSKTDVLLMIYDISKMNMQELQNHFTVVSVSDIDDKARKFLNKALDIKVAELDAEIKIDPLVVSASISED